MAANDSLVARRYAQAVLELALEQNTLDQWRSDFATLTDVWANTPIVARFDDPGRSRTRRMEEARTLLQGQVSPLALNLVLLLVQRGRANLAPLIANAFDRLNRERENRVTAEVTSAVALTSEQRRNLEQQLSGRTGRTVDLRERVDPSILGGLIVRVGDELIDASIIARLRRIEAQLSS